VSRLTLFGLCALIWLSSCNHCISDCFLWSANLERPSLKYAASVRNYLQLFRWDFIFSQTFPLVNLLSPLSFEFSSVAYLFEMSACYCCVSRPLTSWPRISLHHTFVFLVYLLAFFPLNLLPPEIVQYHGQLLLLIVGMCDIWMLSLVNQGIILLTVSLTIRRGIIVFPNVSMWEHRDVYRFLDVAQCTSRTSVILLFSSILSIPFDSLKYFFTLILQWNCLTEFTYGT
jgi:hypothetical protein